MAFDLAGKAVKNLRLPTVNYNNSTIKIIPAQEGDINSRFLSVTLFDDRGTISLDYYTKATLNVTLPDGELQMAEGEIDKDKNIVVCKIAGSMLSQLGKVSCDILLTGSDASGTATSLTSQTFYLFVSKSQAGDDAIKGSDDDTLIVQLLNGVSELEGNVETVKAYVDYTYLPKYRLGTSPLLHFGGFIGSSTAYLIAHLSEVIDPSAVYFVAKGGKETYIKPELITEELKTKYHVPSGMSNDARYYIPITDELIVLEYYISSTEAYYYLHTSADSIGTVEEVYVGKAQNLIDDSYDSYYNLWSARKTKECIDALRQSANYTVPVVDSPPTAHLPTEQGQMYMEERTNKVYIAVEDDGGTPVWKEVPFSESIDGKLDKITTTDGYNRAYGVSFEGNQMSFRVANSALASALVQRDSNGNIKAGTPVEDTDAVPKSYADGKVDDSTTDTEHAWSGSKVNNALNGLAQGMSGMGNGLTQAINGKLDKITTASSNSKVYGIEKDGSQTSFIVATGTTIGGIPMWDGNGALKTNAPVNNTDCANKKYVDAIKPILGGASDPDTATDAGFLGRLYVNEASGKLFYAAQNVSSGSYEWRDICSPKAIKQTSAPTGSTVGYVGQLCLVGSSEFSPFDVYICVYSNPADNQYLWHKMCTTEAPS